MEPFTVDGFSVELTFGLIAGQDTAGATALADLAKPNASIELPVTPSGATRLEIHLEGTGCVGQTGIVHLHTNNSGALACTLSSGATGASGPVFTGGTMLFAGAGITSAPPIIIQITGESPSHSGASALGDTNPHVPDRRTP